MAVSPLQLTGFSNVNNLVDQSQWNTLGNLRNVYQQQEDRQTKLAALGNLGTDPQANMQALLTSHDPALAQIGINMQQKQIDQAREDARYKVTDARANTLLGIQVAAAKRAAADAAQADADRAAAPGLVAGTIPGGAPQATPFPAPLPGAVPQGLPPPGAAPPTAAPPVASPVAPVAPPVAAPASFQQPPPVAPPIKAADDEPDLSKPSWLTDPVAGRVAENLTSPHPAAAAGVTREQLGQLYANPITKPLATAMLQKMYDPGTWSFQQVGDKLVGTSTRGETKVVMSDTKPLVVGSHALVPDGSGGYRDIAPQTPTQLDEGKRLIVPDPNAPGGYRDATPGGAPASKEQRVRDERYADAIARKYPEDVAREYSLTGKLPGEELKPGQQKRVDTLTDNSRVSGRVLDQVKQLRTISKDAWGFTGAGPASLAAATVLPNSLATASGAVATQDLINAAHSNVANVAKSVFGSRVSNLDVNLLKDLESSASQPDVVRQKIYDRAEKVFSKIQQEDDAEAEGIRNKTWYRPGGGERGAPSGNGPVDFRTYFGK